MERGGTRVGGGVYDRVGWGVLSILLPIICCDAYKWSFLVLCGIFLMCFVMLMLIGAGSCGSVTRAVRSGERENRGGGRKSTVHIHPFAISRHELEGGRTGWVREVQTRLPCPSPPLYFEAHFPF